MPHERSDNLNVSSESNSQEYQHTKEIESLLLASRAVLAYSNFEESAFEIFNQAKAMTGATAGYVALLNDSGEENEVLFLDAGGRPCTVDPELPMPIRGLRAEAYHKNTTVFENDFWGSEWKEYLPEGHVEMGNVMFAPLIIDNKTVGIIGLANKDGDFTEADARMATAYGEFAAIALYNSRNLDKLRETVGELKQALEEVKTLQGIIPICSTCKKVRDDTGYWSQVEEYISRRSDADFSHGLCPDCYDKLMEQL